MTQGPTPKHFLHRLSGRTGIPAGLFDALLINQGRRCGYIVMHQVLPFISDFTCALIPGRSEVDMRKSFLRCQTIPREVL